MKSRCHIIWLTLSPVCLTQGPSFVWILLFWLLTSTLEVMTVLAADGGCHARVVKGNAADRDISIRRRAAQGRGDTPLPARLLPHSSHSAQRTACLWVRALR